MMNGKKFDNSITGTITDIQRFSVHDGAGIRTIFFLKGCPLRCLWCHNPETNLVQEEMVWYQDKCIGCRKCMEACPRKAISPEGMYDLSRCNGCGICTDVCCTKARAKVGYRITVEEAIGQVERDLVFYRMTGGGLTLSGGEPTAQPQFSAALMAAAHSIGVHTALETCGFCSWETLLSIAEHTDTVLYDIKHTDPQAHCKLTGVDNTLILENLYKLSEQHEQIIIRVPLIPGVNNQESTLKAISKIATDIHAHQIHLLPFHQLGESKWRALNRKYTYQGKSGADALSMQTAREILIASGIPVNVGGAGD